MIDKEATSRGVQHVAVDCAGGTRYGLRCRRFQWFAADRLPERWYCHDHRTHA